MERQRHKGAFLLVEGAHDARRFKKFFDDTSCSIINCFGKDNVTGTIENEQNSANDDVIGFVDVDFDRITGTHADNDDIIHSVHHDFDLDVCLSDAIERYFIEVCDERKVVDFGGCRPCVTNILESLKPLSALRYANQRHRLGYSLKELKHDEFYDGATVDIDALINHVSDARFDTVGHRQALRGYISQYTSSDLNLLQLTNGHDFCAALGISLRSRIGRRNNPQTWGSEVEKHLRLAFDINDFRETGILRLIQNWEQRNGHRILKGSTMQ